MIRGARTSLLAAAWVVLAGASVSSEPQQDGGEVALETRSSVSRGMITVAPDGSDTALFVRCGDLRELTQGEADRLDSLLAYTPLLPAELDSGFVAAFLFERGERRVLVAQDRSRAIVTDESYRYEQPRKWLEATAAAVVDSLNTIAEEAFRRPPPARPEIRTVVDSAWVRRD